MVPLSSPVMAQPSVEEQNPPSSGGFAVFGDAEIIS
jgi:hypothetical protein